LLSHSKDERRLIEQGPDEKPKPKTGGWRNFYYEEYHNLCVLANISKMMASNDVMIGAHNKHGRNKKAYRFLIGNMKGRDNLEYLDGNERILLKWNLMKLFVKL
jgi:hypothetical protein